MGRYPYMAPEQLLADERSRASDVYSLGVTLFQLVTGRLPFTGGDPMIKMQILAAPPPGVSGSCATRRRDWTPYSSAPLEGPSRPIPVGPGVREALEGLTPQPC